MLAALALEVACSFTQRQAHQLTATTVHDTCKQIGTAGLDNGQGIISETEAAVFSALHCGRQQLPDQSFAPGWALYVTSAGLMLNLLLLSVLHGFASLVRPSGHMQTAPG